jgi:Leucine-rich repeat (LRR) protein
MLQHTLHAASLLHCSSVLLRVLELHSNCLTTLPLELQALKQLRHLTLADNKVNKLQRTLMS